MDCLLNTSLENVFMSVGCMRPLHYIVGVSRVILQPFCILNRN